MKILLFFLFSALCLGMVKSQPLADSLNFPFKRGEKLVYNVYFKSFITGKINAGEIIMEVKNTNRSINGRNTFHVECAGKSKRTFNWFMKVDDKFESYMDEQSLTPLLFIRQTREGHYKKDDHVEFLPHQNQAISRKKINKIPPVVHDILSACYYARTKDFSRMKPGEDFSLPIFFDDSVFTSRIVFHNREVVQTKMGSFNCISFRPMVLTGNVFSNRYPMTVWITDDENKIPLLVRSALILGRIEIELVKSSGLAFPLLSQVEKLKKEEMKN